MMARKSQARFQIIQVSFSACSRFSPIIDKIILCLATRLDSVRFRTLKQFHIFCFACWNKILLCLLNENLTENAANNNSFNN